MSLKKIAQLKPDESQLLYSAQIDEQNIEVREWEQYRWLHIGDSSVQTLMKLGAVDQVALPNIRALLTVLIFCPSPKRLLNLGLGGASLERYLNAKHSEITVKSVESNEKIIQLADDFFLLPDAIDVVHDTAEHFLSNNRDTYNIILCDIFVADIQASCLYQNKFYADIFNCLDKNGVLAINILPESEDDIVNILLPIKNYFNHIYLLEFSEYSNVIIFVSCYKLPEIKELKKRAKELFKKTGLDLSDIPDRLHTILETV